MNITAIETSRLVNQPHFQFDDMTSIWHCFMPVVPKNTSDPITAKIYSWNPEDVEMTIEPFTSRLVAYWNFADYGHRIDEDATKQVADEIKQTLTDKEFFDTYGQTTTTKLTYADHGFVWHLDPFWQEFFTEIRNCGEVSDEFYDSLSLATWWGTDHIKGLVHGEASVLNRHDLRTAAKTLDELDKNSVSNIDPFWQRLVVSLAYNAITDSSFFEELATYSNRPLKDIQKMLDIAAGAVLQHPNFRLTGFQQLSPQ